MYLVVNIIHAIYLKRKEQSLLKRYRNLTSVSLPQYLILSLEYHYLLIAVVIQHLVQLFIVIITS